MGKRMGKFLTMQKAFYFRDNGDRLYVSRKKGGGGRTSITNRIDESINVLEDYIKKSKEILITAANTNIGVRIINRKPIQKRKHKREEK